MMKRSLSKLIGTHSGSFHCDEALAIAMLKRLPEWSDASVVRTRDEATLAQCDLVVDVGSVYDAERLRFDHHQRGFETFFDGRTTSKLSSAGLVFKHFGQRIVAAHLAASSGADASLVDLVWRRLYVSFIEAVDAIDNGVARFDTTSAAALRSAHGLGVACRPAERRRGWSTLTDAETDLRFASAVALTGAEFRDAFESRRAAVAAGALHCRSRRQPSGSRSTPAGASFACRATARGSSTFLRSPAPSRSSTCSTTRSDGKQCRVAAVAVGAGSFASRKALPAPWRGLRDGELDRVTQIPWRRLRARQRLHWRRERWRHSTRNGASGGIVQ
jgi:urease accessory protein